MKTNNFFDRTEPESEGKIKRRTFFSFLVFIMANITGFFSWKWLLHQPKDGGALQPLRNTMEANETLFKSAFSDNRLVKTYPKSAAVQNVRVNSLIGLEPNTTEDTWRLTVRKKDGSEVKFGLEDIKKLPKQDIVFDFKCVEGWSQIQYWSGVPLKDFIETAGLADQTGMKYIGMQTPNRRYYVGLDMPSALHPQTMLCYEMNGKPLTIQHGYPLRLIIPVKYGIKNLKCIGLLYFTNTKPRDYWAERGYDFYSGL